MKIHVHLGAHKTATTFIQSQLHDNRSSLRAGHVGFAGIWEIRRKFTGLFERLSWIDGVWGALTRPYLRRRLAAIIDAQHDVGTFILSDENLLGPIAANYWFGRLYPQAGIRVRILDALLKPRDVHYFLAIRRYPDYLTSSWLQLASRGKAPAFDEYRARFGPEKRGWGELVAEIAHACGPERLTVWTYEWFNADPARVFSLLAPGVPFPMPEEELRRDVLPSLSLKGLRVLSELENYLSESEMKELGRVIRGFPFEEPNPRLEIADPGLLSAYDEKYRADLNRIRALGVDLHA